MHSSDTVDAFSMDVWGPDHILQLSTQVHLINFNFSWRGSCICQIWKGSPWCEFWSSEDSQNVKIHLIYSFENFDALSVDVWGADHVLKPSPQAHLIIFYFSGRGSCICQIWKGSPEVSSGPLRTIKINNIYPMYSVANVDVLLLDVWGPYHVL